MALTWCCRLASTRTSPSSMWMSLLMSTSSVQTLGTLSVRLHLTFIDETLSGTDVSTYQCWIHHDICKIVMQAQLRQLASHAALPIHAWCHACWIAAEGVVFTLRECRRWHGE